jgi:hypothetical protein
MSRISYCREQARVCRKLAVQISNERGVALLRNMALSYEAEADGLDKHRQAQSSPASSGAPAGKG